MLKNYLLKKIEKFKKKLFELHLFSVYNLLVYKKKNFFIFIQPFKCFTPTSMYYIKKEADSFLFTKNKSLHYS